MTTLARALAASALSLLALSAAQVHAAEEHFTYITGSHAVGHLDAVTTGATTAIDYDIKENGRGPTIKETVTLGAGGLPVAWTITGATTFGSKVDERFTLKGRNASWSSSGTPGTAKVAAPALYVTQNASPYELGIEARALLAAPGRTLPALPGGTLRLEQGQSLTVAGEGGPVKVTHYLISGVDNAPVQLLLDEGGALFASIDPGSVLVRKGYEGAEVQLRKIAEDYLTQRDTSLAAKLAHRYDGPVRIRNVRLFDPVAKALTDPVEVVVSGRSIAAIEPPGSKATPGEVTIEGAGGTLVPGMTDMHAHIWAGEGMLDLLAGITTVRDMGNDNAVLAALIRDFDSGKVAGPRVVRSGLIEGRSPYNASNGIVVDSQEGAIDAVRWYAARGFWQIKSYNSMKPEWMPAVIGEAHRLGLRVAGHVPAFSTADAMMAAGYDEMTHINQVALGWVIKPGEDTRTLFRLTALKRLAGFDPDSAPVTATIATMASKHIALDATLGIHEALLLRRDGELAPGEADYADHLPIVGQRAARSAMIDATRPEDDKAYRGAYTTLVAVLRRMHDAGVFLVPGTDTGGSFTYHRELELYQQFGMTPGEILARATLDVQRYMGRDQQLGSIAKGKLADFFLIPGDPLKDLKAIKTISMVVKDGAVFFPAEAYPEYGIKPFVAAPGVTLPKPATPAAPAS